jgi:hypothetical protein
MCAGRGGGNMLGEEGRMHTHLNSNGRCSALTSVMEALPLAPLMRHWPKLTAGRSKKTRGSETRPTTRKGTSMFCSGIWNDQKDSAIESTVGTYLQGARRRWEGGGGFVVVVVVVVVVVCVCVCVCVR